MVRDLEQMKENEEKQVKTTTEKNGHLCCSEHSDLLESHPNKMCHRSDGGCTCYYCTIFGHTVSLASHIKHLKLQVYVNAIGFFYRNALTVAQTRHEIDCERGYISSIARIQQKMHHHRILRM